MKAMISRSVIVLNLERVRFLASMRKWAMGLVLLNLTGALEVEALWASPLWQNHLR